MRTISAVLLSAGLVGCAGPGIKPFYGQIYRVTEPFDAEQAAEALRPGPHTVRGSGFMRQAGGGVVTCAGETVRLIPATAYALRHMTMIYGSSSNLEVGFARIGAARVEPTPEAFLTLQRTVRCDAQGKFAFKGVADGTYLVELTVQWAGGFGPQGGSLLKRVTVGGAAEDELVIAP